MISIAMKNLYALILVLFLFQFKAIAQETDLVEKVYTNRMDSLLDDVLFGDEELNFLLGLKKNYQFLYMRSNFDAKTFYAGREIGENQFNVSNQIFYLNSNGLYGGIAGTWYSQFDPGYRTTILKAGYGNHLKKLPNLRYRTSFDYYIFHYQDPEYESPYFGAYNAGLSYKLKNLGTRFDASFPLGGEFDYQFNWNTYAYLNLYKWDRFSKIRLEPEISCYFGQEIALFSLEEAIIDPVTNLVYSSYYDELFGLLNVKLELPLSLTVKNFDFEVAWQMNLPITQSDMVSYPRSSMLRFSVGYIFDF